MLSAVIRSRHSYPAMLLAEQQVDQRPVHPGPLVTFIPSFLECRLYLRPFCTFANEGGDMLPMQAVILYGMIPLCISLRVKRKSLRGQLLVRRARRPSQTGRGHRRKGLNSFCVILRTFCGFRVSVLCTDNDFPRYYLTAVLVFIKSEYARPSHTEFSTKTYEGFTVMSHIFITDLSVK